MLATIGVPEYRRQLAQRYLRLIVANLKRIDAAEDAWSGEVSQSTGSYVCRSNLDGTGGTAPYIDPRPAGPVPGTYGIKVMGMPATFDGGTNGAMNAGQWLKGCGADPVSCGL